MDVSLPLTSRASTPSTTSAGFWPTPPRRSRRGGWGGACGATISSSKGGRRTSPGPAPGRRGPRSAGARPRADRLQPAARRGRRGAAARYGAGGRRSRPRVHDRHVALARAARLPTVAGHALPDVVGGGLERTPLKRLWGAAAPQIRSEAGGLAVSVRQRVPSSSQRTARIAAASLKVRPDFHGGSPP